MSYTEFYAIFHLEKFVLTCRSRQRFSSFLRYNTITYFKGLELSHFCWLQRFWKIYRNLKCSIKNSLFMTCFWHELQRQMVTKWMQLNAFIDRKGLRAQFWSCAQGEFTRRTEEIRRGRWILFSPAPSLIRAALEERRRSKEKAGSTRGSYRPSKA